VSQKLAKKQERARSDHGSQFLTTSGHYKRAISDWAHCPINQLGVLHLVVEEKFQAADSCREFGMLKIRADQRVRIVDVYSRMCLGYDLYQDSDNRY
jgi:hypothetical protein